MWKICCFLHRVLTQTAGTCRCMFTAVNRETMGCLSAPQQRCRRPPKTATVAPPRFFYTVTIPGTCRCTTTSVATLSKNTCGNPRFLALSGRELLSCTTTGKTTTCPRTATVGCPRAALSGPQQRAWTQPCPRAAPGESHRSAAQQAICVPCLCGTTAMSSTLTMN